MHFPRTNLLLLLALVAILFSACKQDPEDCPPDGHDNTNDVTALAGEWIRVLSNNPGNDGMEVTVVGEEGIVSAEPRNSFTIGVVKWRGIASMEPSGFSYEELGSDGAYYPATMEITGDTLYLTIQNSGAGNQQRYVKKDAYTDPGPSDETITLDCSGLSASNSRLVNSAAAIDYIVPNNCVLDITFPLEIEAGTVIQFEENAGIGVYDNGSINAVGTADLPIVMEGTQSVPGFWRGIHIETNSINNQFDYVSVSDAGSNYVYCCNTVASVFLKGGTLGIQNSTISNGEGFGLYANEPAEFSNYLNNTITTHAEAPLYVHGERLDEIDGRGSSYTGNDVDYIRIISSVINKAITIPANDVPYLQDAAVLDITEDVTVSAGVEWAFQENSGLGIYDNGSFNASGTATAPIILRGEQRVRGYWRGLHLETNSLNNQFEYVQVSDAGSDYVYCCNTVASMFFKDGRASLAHVTISGGNAYGIATKSAFEFVEVEDLDISDNLQEPLYISAVQAGALDGLGSDYIGNDIDVIYIYNSELDQASSWDETNIPYYIDDVIDITSPLTMEPGVEIWFAENGGLGVYDNGTLNAVGTASNNIIMRGFDDVRAYWRGIHTETNSNSNVLEYVQLLDAGQNYVYCCNDLANLYVKSGQMTVRNSTISGSGGCGINVSSSATLTEENNTFSDNVDGNICN